MSKIQDKEVPRNDILLEKKCVGVHTSIFCCVFVCIYVFVIKVQCKCIMPVCNANTLQGDSIKIDILYHYSIIHTYSEKHMI